MDKINDDIIKKLLTYFPDTGLFIWNKRDKEWFQNGNGLGNAWKTWNTRYANKVAGTVGLFNKKPYIVIRVLGVSHLAHRLAWLYMTGKFPDEFIDHENGQGRDNRWNNLRQVTHIENCKNSRLGLSNTSGAVGVHWCNRDKRWIAKICVKKKHIGLGYFTDIEDAIAARKAAEMEYGFHHNHGSNRPL